MPQPSAKANRTFRNRYPKPKPAACRSRNMSDTSGVPQELVYLLRMKELNGTLGAYCTQVRIEKGDAIDWQLGD